MQSLYANSRERERVESLAELYSLIVAVDQLEKAYIRDSIKKNDYSEACARLIGQYRTLLRDADVEKAFGDIDEFRAKYKMDSASGVHRLKVGLPATVELSHEAPNPANGVPAQQVAEVTGLFITAMDGLKLNFRAKDQLHPLLSDLVVALNKVTSKSFEGKGKLVQWLITLNKMKIDQVFTEEEARQCLFDLDFAYKHFYSSLA